MKKILLSFFVCVVGFISFWFCQSMSSIECQTEYNLIPFENVDTNYCVQNDLCPVPDNFSQLFINDLEFQSHPVINIEIPDYITWDYTWTESWFNLYVWSWYDVDYINSIIDINSYRPTSQDFTYMFVSGLTLIFPYIFIALLIVFMWKLIKRIFK